MKMDAKRLAELYEVAERWRRDWQRDPRQGVSGYEAASVLFEALAEISRVAGPYLPGVDAPPASAVVPPAGQLFHGAVALELAAEDAQEPERQAALTAVGSWVKALYLGGQ